MENFVESYHLPWTHPHLNSVSRLDAHSSLITESFISQISHHYDSQFAGHGVLPRFAALPEQRMTMAETVLLEGSVLDRRGDKVLLQSGYRATDRKRWCPGVEIPSTAFTDDNGYLRVWYQDGKDDLEE